MVTVSVTQAIGARLKEERRRLGLSQEEIGTIGDVRRATQYLYERGERMPTAAYLVAVAEVGVDFAYVVSGERYGDIKGKLCLDPEVLGTAFQFVDEWCRDGKGRLLDVEYRRALMLGLAKAAAGFKTDDVDWDSLKRQFVVNE